MAEQTSKRQLDIYEITYDDGGVGIMFDGTVRMGWGADDVRRLLRWATSHGVDEVRGIVEDDMGEEW